MKFRLSEQAAAALGRTPDDQPPRAADDYGDEEFTAGLRTPIRPAALGRALSNQHEQDQAPEPWEPTPADVARYRREMVTWTRTSTAFAYNVQWAHLGKGVVLPAATPQESARLALVGERQRLTDADLFFVAPDMVDLVLAAYATMPEYAPRATDLPCPSGFIVFGKQLASRPLMLDEVAFANQLLGGDAAARMASAPHDTPVIAAAWGPYDGGPPRRKAWAPGGGLFINFYSPSGISLTTMSPETRAKARSFLAPISNENEAAFALAPPPGVPMPFGWTEEDYVLRDNEPQDHSSGIAVDGQIVSGHVGPWARMLMATFTLMMQPGLAGETIAATARPERRSTKREGLPARDVRIVHLRRAPAQEHADGTTSVERERHHRWVVRGHWRQQAHGPGRTLRRPKFIAEHIKGPDDKPLLGGEKVNVWDR